MMRAATRAAGKQRIRCGIVGYSMGRYHAGLISKTRGLELVAVCDLDPARLEAAQEDYPGIGVYTDLEAVLEQAGADLVSVVTPHNTHAALVIQCLQAGKHVVVDKPMCITAQEATDMIGAAKRARRTLSVFHNRRWDGDYLAAKEVIGKGVIGDVFHVEMYMGGYGPPPKVWRSDKAISGGAFYDWGAHIVDWALGFVPRKIESVTGFFHKLRWHEATNEDQVQALVRFAGGAVADIQISSLARAPRPRWRILGTLGAILHEGGDTLHVSTEVKGIAAEMHVKAKEPGWAAYYNNIAEHLLRGRPLAVTPESARRVIAIMEAAERSASSHQAVPVPHE